MITRRKFLEHSALAAAGLSLPAPVVDRIRQRLAPAAGFLDIHRPPDFVTIQTTDGEFLLQSESGTRWEQCGVTVSLVEKGSALRVTLSAPNKAIMRLRLRWRGSMKQIRMLLGDAWERGYGDLEWRGVAPDRAMPWYGAAWDGHRTDTYGVRTGANSFCFWQADPEGISLWADVRSGGVGVQLGNRTLEVCDILCRPGGEDETPFAALHSFCAEMCPGPRSVAQPVYGHNDWYCAYGNNSRASVLDDAHRIVDLSPTGSNRPFTVIDDGWQPGRGESPEGLGTWDRGNEKFPDMLTLAAGIRAAGSRPGIWIRPLQAPATAPDIWRLPRQNRTLDPTVPEVRQKVADDIARIRRWGYELIKHDYSTFDILGEWGFQMGIGLTKEGWTYREGPGRTSAEVMNELYRTIRSAAGDALVIGCNTVSHLSAGVFEMCRIGDDTSGKEWGRTRRMGVNSLAFRAAQHGAFYIADPDCAPVTKDVPWELNRQWLDLVARSGTMLFVSIQAGALGDIQRQDVRNALALASGSQPLGEPLDWQQTTQPTRWRLMNHEFDYHWIPPSGASFPQD